MKDESKSTPFCLNGPPLSFRYAAYGQWTNSLSLRFSLVKNTFPGIVKQQNASTYHPHLLVASSVQNIHQMFHRYMRLCMSICITWGQMYVYMHNMRHEMRKKYVLLPQKILLLMLHPFSFFFFVLLQRVLFLQMRKAARKRFG